MPEFPDYIKFDFLLVILGLGSISLVIYLTYFKEVSLNKELFSVLFVFILLFFGLAMLFFGFYEMAQNYHRETRIAKLNYEIKRIELLLKIKHLQKREKRQINLKIK